MKQRIIPIPKHLITIPMIRYSKLVSLLCALLFASALFAQSNGSNSPYSRYGFGMLNDGAGGFNKGMAGLSYGMRNGRDINTSNPASYSAIDSLAFIFDTGFSIQNGNFKNETAGTNARNTSFDYLTAGFRLAPGLGMSLGMLPYSSIGYSIKHNQAVSNENLIQTETYSGNGGLHEVYIGLGWAPVKRLSAGFNIGYLWGNLEHKGAIAFNEAGANSSLLFYESDVRTYKADFGLQYVQSLNKDNSLTLGLTYGLGHNIKSKAHYYRQTIANNKVSAGDSLTCSDAYQLPHTFGAGLVWQHKDNLRVGADYSYQKWADVKAPVFDGTDYVSRTGLFTDRHKFTVGAEYIPDLNGTKWRHYIRYRAGFSYTSPYTLVDGRDGPRNYSVSLGVGLPIINFLNKGSVVNISAQYERVEPQMAGMITENYFRLCIGLTFNEQWFMKWKVN